ncbi:MAG: T9SS-dependent M36 family metallopeptidase [Bacteroidota bacterium]
MKKITLFTIVFLTVSAVFAQYSETAIRELYASKMQQFQLTQSDLQHFVITDQYTDKHNGVTHIYLRQVVNGFEVFNANSSMHLAKNGQLISLENAFVSNAITKTNSTTPGIGVSSAILQAGNEVSMNLQAAMSKTDIQMQANQVIIQDAEVSSEPIKVKMYYLNTAAGLKLSYNVEVLNDETNDWWNVRVDAMDGSIQEKNNWTTHCMISGHTFNHDAAVTFQESLLSRHSHTLGKAGAPVYNVFPFPLESPNHGARKLVSGQEDANASPFGWHDTDGVVGVEYKTTRGNNVFAKEDTIAGNSTNGYSPNGGDSMVFDFPMDSSWMTPNSYLNASITNLFYWNNTIHDIFYNYGFTETAGNYQRNNYDKGGAQNDHVMAEAQDGSGTGNANFSSPSDGQSGRMQMYLWPTSPVVAPKLAISNTASATGSYTATLSNFGPKRFGDINARVLWARDASAADTQACNTLINGAELAGNIALIQRGGSTCANTQRVLNAQNAGAVAVIMVNNSTSTNAMGGTNTSIVIPSVIISSTDGIALRAAVNGGDTVMATIKGLPTVKAYDSDFDNGVIIHEYGHGISNRLTGGPANSNCLSNAEQGGEGWSDFFALALTAKTTDSANTPRGMGTFVINQPVTGLGIRDFKYSRNMSVNPMTYAYVKNTTAVHYIGTIWCSMLWDLHWNMVDKYGFDADIFHGTGGNNKAIQLVIDGLKLQPCSPGFVDARNAILKADSITNGGANKDVIWKTFARRGLGYTASQGASNSVTDGVAKFDLPPGITGVNEAANLASYIQLSPNPTTGTAVLVLPDQLTEAQVTICDITGKIVVDQMMSTDMNQHITLDMSAYQNGLYFVKLTNGGTTFQSKLLLNK